MMHAFLVVLTLLAAILVLYHHLGYPLLLRMLSSTRRRAFRTETAAADRNQVGDSDLPTFTILMPAYNEQELIADKVRNLAALDYPKDKLSVVLACDGCTDATAQAARTAARHEDCAELRLEVLDFASNRGKVAVLNRVLPTIRTDLIALSDVSAMVSANALRVSAERFMDPKIGVLSGAYKLLDAAGTGESAYWRYQSEIKMGEDRLGSTMGVHGAFYSFRRELFEPLEPDVINDDFMLPMQIVSRGYRACYDPRIIATEVEPTSIAQDRARRHRIAAGNMQQLVRMGKLLNPRFGAVAFLFASGKGLRVLMPVCLLVLLIGRGLLAAEYPAFVWLFAAQALAYGLAAIVHLAGTAWLPGPIGRPLQTLHYFMQGHVASFLGAVRYLRGMDNGPWRRVKFMQHEPHSNGA